MHSFEAFSPGLGHAWACAETVRCSLILLLIDGHDGRCVAWARASHRAAPLDLSMAKGGGGSAVQPSKHKLSTPGTAWLAVMLLAIPQSRNQGARSTTRNVASLRGRT